MGGGLGTFCPAVARLLAISLLLAWVAAPFSGAADEMYSFVDSDGVIHVTNVPQDPRFKRVRGYKSVKSGGLHRIALNGKGSPPPLLRRSSLFDEHIRTAA